MTIPTDILLIEDNPADSELIEILLVDCAVGWKVVACANLAEGLHALSSAESQGRFAAVLSDLSLPDSFGLKTFTAVQAAAGRLPVIVLTGNSDKASALEAVRQGAQDYLSKGSLTSELLAKSLHYAIERKRLELSWRDDLEQRVHERTAELSVANRELDESRRFIETVMNATPAIVFVLDLATQRITYINDQLHNLTGLTLDDIRQCDEAFLKRMFHPDDVVPALENMRSLTQLRDGDVHESVVRLRKPDGSWRYLESRCVPFRRSADGTVRLILGASNDVTDRRQAEEVSRQRQEQLVFVTRQAMLGEFASGLAHELNQPLMAAVNYSQAAIRRLKHDDWSRDELTDCLNKVSQQTLLAGEIIKRLRRLVTKKPSEQTDTDVAEMIRETLDMIRPMADRSDVSVRCDIAGELPSVRADRVQLQQVLLNLIRNGLESMQTTDPRDRWLLVTAQQANETAVEISVCDHGTGCDVKHIDRVFEPFFTTKEDGLGMGLPISRSIVEAHGGRIVAQPNRTQGLTFRFTLPLQTGGMT